MGIRTRHVPIIFLCAAAELSAQTFRVLDSFNSSSNATPWGTLIQATNGNLYGTTQFAANDNSGTVFEITPHGTLSTLYAFCSQNGCSDGVAPEAGLVQSAGGYLYGTTNTDGKNGFGTVFQISPTGALTTLYSFCSQTNCTDGQYPASALVQATNGDLYGTTYSGGANNDGTVFKITTGGALTTLYSFCAQTGCVDGMHPEAGLVQAASGALYGTTSGSGGVSGGGTIYEITPEGSLTTLYSFCSLTNCADGSWPRAGLVQSSTGELWGAAIFGGAHGNGTVFKITPAGTFTTVYSFCSQANCVDGASPYAALVEATDGNFYGTTVYGGANGRGVIFKISPSGTPTTLHSFCQQAGGCADGYFALAGLVQDTDGSFYGTAQYGGANSAGTVFGLSVGLGRFVRTQTTTGKEGATVKILGTDLSGASSVTFSGKAAAFTVVRPSEISATVPAGATTGKVEVVTPGGTLVSNTIFRVMP